MKTLIVLSGNNLVNLANYGEFLSKQFNLEWLPESNFIFQNKLVNECVDKDLCFLSLLSNLVKKTITVNELFLEGKETVIIERFILDELIRYRSIMEIHSLGQYYNIFNELVKTLDRICNNINIVHVIIKSTKNSSKFNKYTKYNNEIVVNLIDKLYCCQIFYNRSVLNEIFIDNKSESSINFELSSLINNIINSNVANFRQIVDQEINNPVFKTII